jgi:hypothetical protein
LLKVTQMNNTRLHEGLPQGTLKEEIEILREGQLQNPSLHIQLQTAMCGLFSGALRKAAANRTRISSLKAPEGLGAVRFMVPTTKETQ